MQTIDTYAYASRLHRADPAPRVLLALTVLILCLASERPAVGLLAGAGMAALTIWVGGVPAHVVGRTLLAEGTFLALAVVGVALSVSPSGSPSVPWGQQLGPLWIGTGPAALTQAVRLFARALGGAAAMGFLALTTPLVALIDLLRRWRVPPLLLDLMTLIYRFIFVLLDRLVMMRTAQASRLGYATRRQALRSAGQLAGQLFINTYLRSRRLHLALSSRGFDGELRVLPETYRPAPGLAWLGLALVAALLLAGWGA